MSNLSSHRTAGGEEVWLIPIGIVIAIGAVLYWAGRLAAVIAGTSLHGHALAEFTAFAHVGNPSAAWNANVGSPALYWLLQVLGLITLAAVLAGVWWLVRVIDVGGTRTKRPTKAHDAQGLASRGEVRKTAGGRALTARAWTLRPSVEKPRPEDLGVALGSARGVRCWASVEDSILVFGPPRSGKGLHLVIPSILNYPGAVVTTSTRPDSLPLTLRARSRDDRPVGVFDPQALAVGVPSALRWSPIRGCERPQTAMIRATGLAASSGRESNSDNGSYWLQQTQTVIRCLLHAAAVEGKPSAALYEWSLSHSNAREAVNILASNERATASWDKALDAIVSAEGRRREDVWSMVSNAFSALGDPKVLDAVSPTPSEQFDPVQFIRRRGTLFLLGTSSGASVTGGLVSALIEDIVEAARRIAAASPGARLDPPLGLILDEAANYPLPSLASLMSEGGGTGITTMAVVQSMALARARWGRDEAQGIWDAATVKMILGGNDNKEDLEDLSHVLGEYRTSDHNRSWQPGRWGSSTSETHRDERILKPSMIRELAFGQALLLLRSAKPMVLQLQKWDQRRDAKQIRQDRRHVTDSIRAQAARELGSGV
jgi:type IV secretory pathway TraG/TraD family ATPase VirD4